MTDRCKNITLPQTFAFAGGKNCLTSLSGVSLFSHCSAGNVRELNWFQHIYVFVNSSGLIYYKIRSDYSVTCGLDMTYFPFDTQTCNIDVATQELSSYDANLTKGTGRGACLLRGGGWYPSKH